jgi:hypothetical protein
MWKLEELSIRPLGRGSGQMRSHENGCDLKKATAVAPTSL